MSSLLTRGLGFAPYTLITRGFSPSLPPSTLRHALDAALKADIGVYAVVGGKVYPLRVPQNCGNGPWLLFHVGDINRRESLDGPTGTADAVVKIGCGAKTLAGSEAAAGACRLMLDGFTGRLGGLVTVFSTVSDGEEDVYDPPVDGSDKGTFWAVLNYRFLYSEGR